MAIKTYSRRVSDDRPEPDRKRRRVEFVDVETSDDDTIYVDTSLTRSSAPSSPAGKIDTLISSDGPAESNGTPPSSPPPFTPLDGRRSEKRNVSFFKRTPAIGIGERIPLSTMQENRSSKKTTQKKPRLTQLRIDLGGDPQKTCRICGMEYVPSVPEDVALHKKFHAMNVGGVDFGRSFVKSSAGHSIWRSGTSDHDEEEMVLMVHRNSSVAERNQTRRVLDVVDAELSAAAIEDDRLWGSIMTLEGNDTAAGVTESPGIGRKFGRYKVYLFVKGSRCIGLCLAERISKAYTVLDNSADDAVAIELSKTSVPSASSSVSLSKQTQSALLGVSRIWTSSSHRRKGIAWRLLQCATHNFVYGMDVPKELVAFSQPTASGLGLATRWFGSGQPCRVYIEQ